MDTFSSDTTGWAEFENIMEDESWKKFMWITPRDDPYRWPVVEEEDIFFSESIMSFLFVSIDLYAGQFLASLID